jgi:Kef-type K+ transport system membrane component KefB
MGINGGLSVSGSINKALGFDANHRTFPSAIASSTIRGNSSSLFFAFTGLRTEIGLLGEPAGWLICGALILVATVGKLGGAMLTARMTAVNWLDSFALGALMNTRGLIELIALNIGYDLRILSPRIFSMLVLMALVTTAMTGPLLSLSNYLRNRKVLAVNPV